MALVNTLYDSFQGNSLNATLWKTTNTYGAGSFIAVGSQTLVITHDVNSYAFITAQNSYDVTGGAIWAQVADAGNLGQVSQEAGIRLNADSTNGGQNLMWLFIGSSGLGAYKVVATVQSQIGGFLAYDATLHRHLRLREAAGTFYYEWSTDKVSWNIFQTLVNPFGTTTFYPELYSGSWQVEAAPSYGRFADFNITTQAGPTRHFTVGNGLGRSEVAN